MELANNNPSAEEAKSAALMVVIPEDVKDAYTERAKGFKSMNLGMRNNGFSNGAYSEGVKAGKSAIASRAIEG